MIGYSPANGAYHVEPESPKYKPKGHGHNFGRAVQGGHEAKKLPSGRWVLARVVWAPFGGGKQETVLPGDYASEADAEKAARRLNKEPERKLHSRNREIIPVRRCPLCFGVEVDGAIQHGQGCEGDRDGDQGKSEEETGAGT